MARDHTQFKGQVVTPFTVMAEFQRNAGDGFSFAFESYVSAVDFDADGSLISRLTFRDDPATGFGTTNQALWQTIRSLVIQEAGLGGRSFTLTEFQWFPLQKVLTWSAEKGEQRSTFVKRGADYDAFIAANQTVFDNLNASAWVHAKGKDAFLNAMTAAA